MTVYFDVTKAIGLEHESGLQRLSRRLVRELSQLLEKESRKLGVALWNSERKCWVNRRGGVIVFEKTDWFITPEIFSEEERPGFSDFLAKPPCRLAAIFTDVIPLKFPHMVSAASVRRHPYYMKFLTAFDVVFAVSESSKRDLESYWKWIGVSKTPPVKVISIGADIGGLSRVKEIKLPPLPMRIMMLGTLETRKNQLVVVEAAVRLWEQGLKFELRVIGRKHPAFGDSIHGRILELGKRFRSLRYDGPMNDDKVERLTGDCVLLVEPSLAEGNGLAMLEAMWHGLPCVLSPLPIFQEQARDGACVIVRENTVDAWAQTLSGLLANRERLVALRLEAARRPLARWVDTAAEVVSVLKSLNSQS